MSSHTSVPASRARRYSSRSMLLSVTTCFVMSLYSSASRLICVLLSVIGVFVSGRVPVLMYSVTVSMACSMSVYVYSRLSVRYSVSFSRGLLWSVTVYVLSFSVSVLVCVSSPIRGLLVGLFRVISTPDSIGVVFAGSVHQQFSSGGRCCLIVSIVGVLVVGLVSVGCCVSVFVMVYSCVSGVCVGVFVMVVWFVCMRWRMSVFPVLFLIVWLRVLVASSVFSSSVSVVMISAVFSVSVMVMVPSGVVDGGFCGVFFGVVLIAIRLAVGVGELGCSWQLSVGVLLLISMSTVFVLFVGVVVSMRYLCVFSSGLRVSQHVMGDVFGPGVMSM